MIPPPFRPSPRRILTFLIRREHRRPNVKCAFLCALWFGELCQTTSLSRSLYESISIWAAPPKRWAVPALSHYVWWCNIWWKRGKSGKYFGGVWKEANLISSTNCQRVPSELTPSWGQIKPCEPKTHSQYSVLASIRRAVSPVCVCVCVCVCGNRTPVWGRINMYHLFNYYFCFKWRTKAGGTLFMPAVSFIFPSLFYSVGSRYIIRHPSSSNYPPKNTSNT